MDDNRQSAEARAKFSIFVAGYDGRGYMPVCGATFELEGENGCTYATVSDERGKAGFVAAPGTYKLRQASAPGDYRSSKAVYHVVASENGDVLIDGKPANAFPPVRNFQRPAGGHTPMKRTLTFTKVDEDGAALPGCTFVLMNRYNGDILKTRSNSKGKVMFRGLKTGEYTLTEIDVPDNCNLSPVSLPVLVDRDGDVTLDGVPSCEAAQMCFENHSIPSNGELSFYAANDRGMYVEGAVFHITADGIPVAEAMSDEDGFVSFSGLHEGSYKLSQIKAPAGYKVSDVGFILDIGSDGHVMVGGRPARDFLNYVFVDTAEHGYAGGFYVSIINNDGEALEGAQFMLYDENLLPSLKAVSDEKGRAVFEPVGYGSYLLRQTCAPHGYCPFTGALAVVVGWDGNVTIAGQPAEYYPPIISRRKNRRG